MLSKLFNILKPKPTNNILLGKYLCKFGVSSIEIRLITGSKTYIEVIHRTAHNVSTLKVERMMPRVSPIEELKLGIHDDKLKEIGCDLNNFNLMPVWK